MLTKIGFAYVYDWRHGFYLKFGLDWTATVVLEKKKNNYLWIYEHVFVYVIFDLYSPVIRILKSNYNLLVILIQMAN